jgi:hypothetical protein
MQIKEIIGVSFPGSVESPPHHEQALEAATCRVRNSSFTMMLCYAAYG